VTGFLKKDQTKPKDAKRKKVNTTPLTGERKLREKDEESIMRLRIAYEALPKIMIVTIR